MYDTQIIVNQLIKFVTETLKRYTRALKDYIRNNNNKTFIIVTKDGTVKSIVVENQILSSEKEIPSDANTGEFFLVVDDNINHIYYIGDNHEHKEVQEFNINEYNKLKSKVDDMESLLMDLIDRGT